MRVVQISDTHVSAATGVSTHLQRLLDWITDDPPDLVVHTGDIVWEDPDNTRDRLFTQQLFSSLPCRVVAVPGNHDVGFFETAKLQSRLAAFNDVWGADRFVLDDRATGWRIVGLDTYAIGYADNDEWVTAALAGPAPVAVFIHQPIVGEPIDGWQLPEAVRTAWLGLLADYDVRLIASGHRHCAAVVDSPGDATHVWAPSTTLTGDHNHHGGNPHPGAVEYRFGPNATFEHRFVYR